jgi:hypothetical protein
LWGFCFAFPANKDEIVMKSNNEGIKKRKKKKRKKLQHNSFVLFVPIKEKKMIISHKSTQMSNISCEKKKRDKRKTHKEQINKTQDNGEEENTTK